MDWRPFDYLTLESTPVVRAPLTLPRSHSTFEFTEDGPGRCVVAMRVRAQERGLWTRLTMPLGIWLIRRQFRAHYEVLARVLEEDRREWSAPSQPGSFADG